MRSIEAPLQRGDWLSRNRTAHNDRFGNEMRFHNMTSNIFPASLRAALCEIYPEGAALEHLDVYQFGVYTGGSMAGQVELLRSLQVSFGTLWGFDSFVGLPAENLTLASARRPRNVLEGQHWAPGSWSAADSLQTSSFETLRQHILRTVGRRKSEGRTELVRGFFANSLTAALARERRLQPALYVDVDSDLYISAMQCLDWLFCSGLMVERVTIVRYDDWSGPDNPVSRYGEKRAHGDISKRHRVVWEFASLGTQFYRVHSYSLDAQHCTALGYDANARAARPVRVLQHPPRVATPQPQPQPQACHERVQLWQRSPSEGLLAECLKAPLRDKKQAWAVGDSFSLERLPPQTAHPTANCSFNVCHNLWSEVLHSCAANGEMPAWVTGTQLKRRCPKPSLVSARWSLMPAQQCLTPVLNEVKQSRRAMRVRARRA